MYKFQGQFDGDMILFENGLKNNASITSNTFAKESLSKRNTLLNVNEAKKICKDKIKGKTRVIGSLTSSVRRLDPKLYDKYKTISSAKGDSFFFKGSGHYMFNSWASVVVYILTCKQQIMPHLFLSPCVLNSSIPMYCGTPYDDQINLCLQKEGYLIKHKDDFVRKSQRGFSAPRGSLCVCS